eukprot:symbB.v1.2.024735.t1/scaffold2365.1/size83366/3
MDVDMERIRKVHWVPLESNPDMLNDFAWKVGLPKDYEFVDVFTFPTMAGASTTFLPKSKRSPRRSPRVRAKPGAVRSGSPGACVRVKAPDESVIPASVFWGGANGEKSSKEAKASSSISSDTKSPGAVSAVALANDSAAVPLATVDLWKASSVLTDSAVSTAQRTMTTPPPPAGREGEAGVSLQPSEREDIAEPAEVQASTELATASTLLAPGTGSPSWTPSRQTWSPRVMQPVSPFLSHRAGRDSLRLNGPSDDCKSRFNVDHAVSANLVSITHDQQQRLDTFVKPT